jgi:Flp pilus assembly protein TadG
MRERGSSERAQASVELIAAIPVLLLLALLVVQAGLAGWTLWSAQNAARAGSRAAAVGGDPGAAARSALPDQLREGASVQAADVIRVRVQAPRVASTVPAFDLQAGARLQEPADGTP